MFALFFFTYLFLFLINKTYFGTQINIVSFYFLVLNMKYEKIHIENILFIVSVPILNLAYIFVYQSFYMPLRFQVGFAIRVSEV